MRRLLIGVLFGAATATSVNAQDRSVRDELRNFGRDAGFIVSSPVQATGSVICAPPA